MSDKITKKELKAPDFLQIQTARLLSFFSQHKSQLYLTLGIIVALFAVGAGWNLYQMNYEKKAYILYSLAGKEDKSEKSEAVDDHKLIEDYQKVTEKYPDSRAALYAFYEIGNKNLELNQPDKAIAAYAEAIKSDKDDNFIKVFAYSGQGYCYEAKKEYPKALSSFTDALHGSAGEIFAAQLYRDMARIYEEMNETAKAKEYYTKSLEKTKDGRMEEIIKRKIAAL